MVASSIFLVHMQKMHDLHIKLSYSSVWCGKMIAAVLFFHLEVCEYSEGSVHAELYTPWVLYIPAYKSRSIYDPVILSSGICSPYKSRSAIDLKSLKIQIIVVIREKVDPIIQTHGVSKCVVNINFFTGRDTHTLRFDVITNINKQTCHTKYT